MASHMTVWLLVTFARQGHWQHCCCPLPDLRCSGLVLVSELSDGCLTLKMTLLGHEWKAVVEIFDQMFFFFLGSIPNLLPPISEHLLGQESC